MPATIDYQVIVGLEIHVQLQTRSKLFCHCSTAFGAPPNTQTCQVCTGMPGALPVLNAEALDLAIKAGLALDCQIERHTKWDRKNYFYPDLPKGYQISQFDRPICFDGGIELVDSRGRPTGKRIGIERAHLEEDAGKSTHDETGGGGKTRIDLNRAGTPLLEIVTRPDLRSEEQARDFLTELKLLLTYIEVSDCNMQQGNLRVDANVNLWLDPDGRIATPIVEIKNLNSFRAVERAIRFEATRQWTQYQETGLTRESTPKQTRGWDEVRQRTVLQREKEESADYRYFPDPDLVAIAVHDETIDTLKRQLPRLPAAHRNSLTQQHRLSAHDADVLVKQGRGVIRFFNDCVQIVGDGKLVSNWIQQNVLRYLNDHQRTIQEYPVTAGDLGELLKQLQDRKLDQNRARDALKVMEEERVGFHAARDKLGIVAVDVSEMAALCRQLITENPDAVADIRAGNTKAIGPLIGQARNANPNVNPGKLRQMILSLLDSG